MKFAKLTRKTGLFTALIFVFGIHVFAQETTTTPLPEQKREQQRAAADKSETKLESAQTVKNDGKTPIVIEARQEKTAPAAKDDKNAREQETSEEEAAILPYYNNYLKEYHLGPEDVISVEVFGQPNYSKAGITIPPTAKISYPLIPGGVFVGGKTTDQIAEEIKKKLDEYIIDPEVTVTLEKVGSAQFSVLGKVGTPGVRLMSRRYNVYEAVIEAGGIAKDGDRKRVMLVRRNPAGGFTQTVINFETVLSGKTEIPYLVPGDQIIVPEKKWSLSKVMDILGKASAFRILFGMPF